MPLSYGSGLPPEMVEHTLRDRDGQTRTYRAIATGSGNNWDVQTPDGAVHKNGITNSNRWAASMHLNDLAMRDHDTQRLAVRSSPRTDRVVSVGEAGNYGGAEITGGRRW